MPTRAVAFLALTLLLGSVPASGHHSLAIYSNDTTVLEGEIVDVLWANPHVRISLRTVGTDGKEQVWSLEGGSLMTLQRSGVTSDLMHAGDRVKAAVRVSKRDPLVAGALTLLLPDGREAQLFTGAPANFTGADQFLKRDNGIAGDPARENRGIFRVWTIPNPNPVSIAELQALPFTSEAVAARAKFNLYDNFATRCEPEGMPRIMFNPHPFEFIDHGATLTLRTELYDTERTIHMDRTEPPAGEPASRLGYSVGRWEGRALVVTTTGVSWPYFDNAGTPQSPAVRIVERYTLSDDQSRLDFQVTVTDPATFTAPAVIDGHWLALGGTIPRYDCQPR
jgi:hypothetical protein